jgi:hypothetical protein
MNQKELLALLEAVESDLYKAREENKKKEAKFHNQLETYEKGKFLNNYECLDLQRSIDLVEKNQKAVKKAMTDLFSVFEFYKDKLQLWTENLESTQYNTEILEACVRDNDLYLMKYKHKNKVLHTEIQLGEDTDFDQDVDENYLGVTPALQEAENILQKAKVLVDTTVAHNSENTPKDKDTEFATEALNKTSRSHKAQSLLNRVGSPSRVSCDHILNITQSSFQKPADDDSRSQPGGIKSARIELTNLEAIVEKDFEERDDFMLKWNRYISLMQTALNDRK